MTTEEIFMCHSDLSEASNRATAPRHRHGFLTFLRMTACGILGLFGFLMVVHAADSPLRLSPKKVREEVRAVVQAQLEALRGGDFAEAYALASEGIKQQFDVRLFAALIRRGYPTLLQSKEAELGVVRDRDGAYAQVAVSMLDRQKHTVVYQYWLVKEESGWRITGVVLEQSPARGNL